MNVRSIHSKLMLLIVCFLTVAFLNLSASVLATDRADVDSLVAGNTSFAIDLYKELAQDEGNIFFSPYSISSALAMTYAGARGETARQMAETLHFDLESEKLHAAFSDLTKTYNLPGKQYQLSVANALWGQIGYEFLAEFVGITNKHYGAGFREVDYAGAREEARATINKWVETKTNGKIKDLIQAQDLTPLTRLVLTNAIYFKGQWQTRFNSKDTKPMPFHVSAQSTVDVPMMHLVAQFNYAENSHAQILELPYSGGDLSMVILLPQQGSQLAQLEDVLEPGVVRSWLSQLAKAEVEVFLPRFKSEQRFVLNEALYSLGMRDAFDMSAANFSGMTPGSKLYISKVLHKAFVEVNEEGTEAAAATAVIMNAKLAVPTRPHVFRADRPFIFLIRDLRTGSVLFMGRLVSPAH